MLITTLDLQSQRLRQRLQARGHALDAVHVAPPNVQTRLAAVLIGLRPIAETGSVEMLLTRRPMHLRQHAGQVAFPGGKVEIGETPLQAAIREAHEEVGLPAQAIEPLVLADPLLTARTNFWVTPVVAWIDPLFDTSTLQLDVGEVDELFWADLHRLSDPAIHRPMPVTFPGGAEVIDYFDYPHPDGDTKVIWGATAAILRKFFLRFFDLNLPTQ